MPTIEAESPGEGELFDGFGFEPEPEPDRPMLGKRVMGGSTLDMGASTDAAPPPSPVAEDRAAEAQREAEREYAAKLEREAARKAALLEQDLVQQKAAEAAAELQAQQRKAASEAAERREQKQKAAEAAQLLEQQQKAAEAAQLREQRQPAASNPPPASPIPTRSMAARIRTLDARVIAERSSPSARVLRSPATQGNWRRSPLANRNGNPPLLATLCPTAAYGAFNRPKRKQPGPGQGHAAKGAHGRGGRRYREPRSTGRCGSTVDRQGDPEADCGAARAWSA